MVRGCSVKDLKLHFHSCPLLGVPGLVSGSLVVQYLIHNNWCTVNMCRVHSVRVYVSVNNSIIHSAVDSPLLLLCLGSYKEHNIKNVESSSPQSKQNSLKSVEDLRCKYSNFSLEK